MIEQYDPNMENFGDVFEQFESKTYRQYISGVSAGWLSQVRDWKHFVTLTFKDDVSDDKGLLEFKLLIRRLNVAAFGNNYTRKVGHSYFSYVCGIEKQDRGTIHFHVIMDRPIDLNGLWDFWFHRNGYEKHEYLETPDSPLKAISYSLKYATKNGEAIIYLAKNEKTPEMLPYWWLEDRLHSVTQG